MTAVNECARNESKCMLTWARWIGKGARRRFGLIVNGLWYDWRLQDWPAPLAALDRDLAPEVMHGTACD
jgi:hypothetical protein